MLRTLTYHTNYPPAQIQRVIGEEDVARFRRELGEEAGGEAESDEDGDEEMEGSGEI